MVTKMFNFNAKAQTVAEYLVVVMLVITALTVMQLYMKRGLQATIKVAADELAPQNKSDLVQNIDKGGFLWESHASTNMQRLQTHKDSYSGEANYTLGESVNVEQVSTYSQGRMVGDFCRE